MSRAFADACGPNCAADFYACLEKQVDNQNYGAADMCNRREIMDELCQLKNVYAQKAQQECDFGTRAVFMKIIGVLDEMATRYKHAHLKMIEKKTEKQEIYQKTRAVDDIVDSVARIAFEMEESSADAKLKEYQSELERLKRALPPPDESAIDTDEEVL